MSEIKKGRLDELAEVIDAEHRAFVRTSIPTWDEEPGNLILPTQLLSFTAANIHPSALQGAWPQ